MVSGSGNFTLFIYNVEIGHLQHMQQKYKSLCNHDRLSLFLAQDDDATSLMHRSRF